jgi:hypothetical protein
VGHEQVPALYDQSLGKFYFRPGAPGAAPAAGIASLPAASPIHVPTPAELDESYWLGIKSSTDASDFTSYAKSFPKGMHVAEAEMMTRKLSRTSAKSAVPPEAASAASLKPGGPYHGFVTSSLLPGKVFPSTRTARSIPRMNMAITAMARSIPRIRTTSSSRRSAISVILGEFKGDIRTGRSAPRAYLRAGWSMA